MYDGMGHSNSGELSSTLQVEQFLEGLIVWRVKDSLALSPFLLLHLLISIREIFHGLSLALSRCRGSGHGKPVGIRVDDDIVVVIGTVLDQGDGRFAVVLVNRHLLVRFVDSVESNHFLMLVCCQRSIVVFGLDAIMVLWEQRNF